jgi:hypothetical protein
MNIVLLQPIYLRYSVMCEPLHVFTIDERIKSEGGAIMASLWPTGVVPWRWGNLGISPGKIWV